MRNLPEVKDRAFSRVPVELWRDIFEFGTVPRKYEFTMDGGAYIMADEASRTETGIPTPEETTENTKFRFSIVQVCKDWYAIGIQALWSHLSIDLCAEPILVIEGIQESINRNTEIASYVTRLTLVEDKQIRAERRTLERSLWRLTSQLPSLRIFIGPGIYACGMAKPSLDIVVWTQHISPNVFHRALEQTTYIQNTQVLSISLRADIGPPLWLNWNPVLFSRLESLYLQIYSSEIIKNITRSWEIPNLHLLSLKSSSITDLLEFIEKWSTNIEILELTIDQPEWPRPIQLPNLKELRVGGHLSRYYRITVPKLERFCLLSFQDFYPPQQNDVVIAIKHAISSFPALRRLKFRGLTKDSFLDSTAVPFDYGLTSPDIHEWTKAGPDVDVLLSQCKRGANHRMVIEWFLNH
jgi:hypothetical protein